MELPGAEMTNCFDDTELLQPVTVEQFKKGLSVLDIQRLEPSASSTSKGNQTKWYDKENRLFIKKAFEYQGHIWKDYLCEKIAMVIGSQLGMLMADTKPCIILDNGAEVIGSMSSSFLSNNEQFIPFQRLLNMAQYDVTSKHYRDMSSMERIQSAVDVYAQYYGIDARQYLYEMICLDFLIGNEDRHHNNFGVIRGADGYRLPPHFDNGLALFEHDTKYMGAPLQVCIRKMKGKPFNTDLKKVYRAATQLFKNCRLGAMRIDLTDCLFPSDKAIDYIKYAAGEMGLAVTGKERVLVL